MLKTPRIKSEKHRRFIASLPCLITSHDDVQAAHIRHGTGGGMGLKPSDEWCVPLSVQQHSEQHRIGEVCYWSKYGGIEPAKRLAKALYAVSGDRKLALEAITQWRLYAFLSP